MMYGIPLGSTRAALLVESKDRDGNVVIEVHNLRLISTSYDLSLNLFDGGLARVTVEGVVQSQGVWHGPMPDSEQEEIEPARLALESNEVIEGEIVEDEDDYEWAFRDTNPDGIQGIITHNYGVPITSYDSAKKLGDQNVLGRTVVLRRKLRSGDEWEIVSG